MRRAPHPQYSPDLAPSNFFLFGYIKKLLSECEFSDWDSLLQRVRDISGGIETVTLEGAFLDWVERLHQYSAMNEEDVE
jgi:hypothetical protein